MKILWPLTLLLLLCSCAPKVVMKITESRAPRDAGEDFIVLSEAHVQPDDAEILGSISIGDTGFSTNCNYDRVVCLATQKALEAGGNALKITEHRFPSIASSCHRISALILYIPDLTYRDFPLEREAQLSMLPQADPFELSLFEEGCAMLHFYRLPGNVGTAVVYDILVNDEIITRSRNSSRETVKIKALGNTCFRIVSGGGAEMTIDVQPGHHYYIRSAVGYGVWAGRPVLEKVDPLIGEREFREAIPSANTHQP